MALVVSLQGAAAGPTPEATKPASILPENIGSGIPTTDAVLIRFDTSMDQASVLDALDLQPATGFRAAWSDEGRLLRLIPEARWMTDQRYSLRIGSGAHLSDGAPLADAMNLSFTTETAPVVSDFQLFYAAETSGDRARSLMATEADGSSELAQESQGPADTADDVSAATRITVGFSTAMNHRDVERRFAIRPFVAGSFTWEGNALVFEPAERLTPGARYAVSVTGARDARGNKVAGDTSFSFSTRAGAQVVKTAPSTAAAKVGSTVSIWFSQPMDVAATGAALSVVDATTGDTVRGTISWNSAGTQVTYRPAAALAHAHAFRIALEAGARDVDRNSVSGAWSFATEKAPPPPPAAPAPQTRPATTTVKPASGPPAPADIQQYALWQINQSRAQYGFAPLRLDAAITQVATAHAWDMMNYGYFSHTGRDGSRVADRLRRAGISFSRSGENICYYNGLGLRGTLNWCHSVFMAEPYPGVANHIGNILSPNFTRVGIGIAQSGGRIKIVWDFAG